MPELPEVETVRRGLQPVLEGARLSRVEARRPDLRFPFPDGFVQRLTGARIEKLERRAKYLMAQLDRGDHWFDRRGPLIVLFGRLIPGVRSLVSVPAGLSEMPRGQFLALTAAGSALWNAALIGAGWALGENYDEVETIIGPLSRVIVVLLALGIVGALVWHLRRRRRVAG